MNRVFITKVSTNDISSGLSKALDWIEWGKIVKNGDNIFIKANLTLPSYHQGATTNIGIASPCKRSKRKN